MAKYSRLIRTRKNKKSHLKRIGFKTGNTAALSRKSVNESSRQSFASCRWMPRLSTADFNRVVKQSPAGYYHCPNEQGTDSGRYKLLRPKKETDQVMKKKDEKVSSKMTICEMQLLHDDIWCE